MGMGVSSFSHSFGSIVHAGSGRRKGGRSNTPDRLIQSPAASVREHNNGLSNLAIFFRT